MWYIKKGICIKRQISNNKIPNVLTFAYFSISCKAKVADMKISYETDLLVHGAQITSGFCILGFGDDPDMNVHNQSMKKYNRIPIKAISVTKNDPNEKFWKKFIKLCPKHDVTDALMIGRNKYDK